MKKPLHVIHEKIGSIQVGLLRYEHNDTKVSLHAEVTTDTNELLHCTVYEDIPSYKLMNKEITLVQKDNDNYMYVDGRISKVVKEKEMVISIDIKKAFWFILKRKGSVTSLHEKCF